MCATALKPGTRLRPSRGPRHLPPPRLVRPTLTQLAYEAAGGQRALGAELDALSQPLPSDPSWLDAPLLRVHDVARARLRRTYGLVAEAERSPHAPLVGLAERALRRQQPEMLVSAVEVQHHRHAALPLAFCAQLGAALAEAPVGAERALYDYGLTLGRAMALADDLHVLRRGDDAPGRVPHPVALAIARLPAPTARVLLRAVMAGDLRSICSDATVQETTQRSTELMISLGERAMNHLLVLPDSRARRWLMSLARTVGPR